MRRGGRLRGAGMNTAFTIELLPVPRTPHSRALLAGRPMAKRRGFSAKGLLLAVDAHQQVEVDPVHLGDRFEPVAGARARHRLRPRRCRRRRRRRGEPVERFGDA